MGSNLNYIDINQESRFDPIYLGGEAKYWPLCDESYFPMSSQKAMLTFDKWWDSEAIFESGASVLTRRDLVLTVANKDGGAHFDSKVSKKYDDFQHHYSGGSCLVGISSGKKRKYDNIPIYPAVRQIGYELLCTLIPQPSLPADARSSRG